MKATHALVAMAVMSFAGLGVSQWRAAQPQSARTEVQSTEGAARVPSLEARSEQVLARKNQGETMVTGYPKASHEPMMETSSSRVGNGASDRALAQSANDELVSLIEQSRAEHSVAVHTSFLEEVAKTLTSRDLSRAGASLEEITNPRDRAFLMGAMTRILTERDPQLAARWVEGISNPNSSAVAHETLAREWARSDVDGVIEWLGTLPDAQVQSAAVEGLVWTWAQQNPNEVVEWANKLEDLPLRNKVLLKTAKMLALNDPAQAAAWTLHLPEGADQQAALIYAMHQWRGRDARAAETWLKSIENPELRHSAMAALE